MQALLDGVKNAEINCIIVKDFSRFARDYIELGSYLEQIFPFMGVRFISVNDKYDSDRYEGNPADIDVNFKNLLYDIYSKDLSVKVKASLRAVKEQGKSVCTVPPFGYAKDPEDRHKYVIDEDDASTVRRLFRMYADGMSTVEIAKVFNAEGVKTPSQVWMEQLSQAEDKVRELNRMKVHESFAVTKLTPELLDEYVESIEVFSDDDVRISWK